MKTILFQGDSITDYGRNREDPASIGEGYALFVRAMLNNKYPQQFNFINRGVSGSRICDLYTRERVDGICLKPDFASFLIGVNDAGRMLDEDNGVTPKRYRDFYEMIIEDFLDEVPSIKIMMLEPFVLCGNAVASTPERPERFKAMDEAVREYARIAREVADKFGLHFIPLQKRFDEEAEKYGPEYILFDGVHPTEYANTIIASEWVKGFESIK